MPTPLSSTLRSRTTCDTSQPQVGTTSLVERLRKLTYGLIVGRDKVLRTIQYFSRFYAWYLYRTNNPTSAIQPWTTIKNQFGLTRKILRIGKFVEHIRAASELYDVAMKQGSGDKVVQYLQTLRQIGYAGYMLFDTMTVLDAMGVKKYESAKRLQATAYRFWFTGLVASALAGIYSLYQLSQRTKQVDEKDPDGKMEKVKIEKSVLPYL